VTHITGHDRSQTLLLPESLDDYVGPENPVRFIEAFVDGLDLAAAGFARVQSKETGGPGYAPSDLLKLYICMVTSTASDPAAGSKPRRTPISR
jgi:transposase